MQGEQVTPSKGFMVLQGNRLEDLRDITLAWMQHHPVHPLERTTFLVQSNGIAQWLKTSIAEQGTEQGHGICLGVEVMLPARFQWLAYRSLIEAREGAGSVPASSPYDKSRLRWRLMEWLPEKLSDPLFAPLARYLDEDDDQRKCYQLAERLADLFDQYQVYRADWLDAWEAGRDVLILAGHREVPVPEDQRWQPHLWREIGARLDDADRLTHRAAVHRRFLDAVGALTADERPADIAPRIVVFGISSLPQQTLEVLAALSGVTEVILCLLNPCRHYWGEIIDHQELLRRHYRHHRKEGMPVDLPLEQMHLHAHPLLAAWGKQGRDYLQLLSAHDGTERYTEAFAAIQQSVDCFLSPDTERLLGQLQDDILELRPLRETRETWPALDPGQDHSLAFHVCHSPQRELEVLHDQLLAALSEDSSLAPRDIIVMVPDINDYAPYIHATFGQFAPGEDRHIPYHVADQRQRHREPLLVALEALLSLPRLRFRASEILDLLDIPALRARFGIDEGDLPTLQRWIHGANIRWGLDTRQRSDLGLPEHNELHTWTFGLERMLLGYSIGDADTESDDWEGVVPYAEAAGLDAGLVGPLYRLIQTLAAYRDRLQQPMDADAWMRVLSALLEDTLAPASPREEALLDQIQTALEDWHQEIQEAGVERELTLAVVRESWLGRLDEPQLSQSFLMGSVTFATLMPMRAIPFRQVCLLGMNDGQYPRRANHLDFDLMGMRGHYRPGDRSRREDDRYLFLEALLSARDRLYISWSGRSPQDNAEKPPSVLVGQLRDHLGKGWRLASVDRNTPETLLEALTTEHPLQPFGAAYFRADSPLFTYATEWQGLRDTERPDEEGSPLPLWVPESELRLQQLIEFLRDPVSALYQQRLNVRLQDDEGTGEDEEPFGFHGLSKWQQQDALLQPLGQRLVADRSLDLETAFEQGVDRRQRAGDYPPEPVGPVIRQDLLERLPDTLAAYRDLLSQFPHAVMPPPEIRRDIEVALTDPDTGMEKRITLRLDDALDHLHGTGDTPGAPGNVARIVLLTSRIHRGDGLHWLQLLRHWPAHLVMQVLYPGASSYLVTPSGTLEIPGFEADAAGKQLDDLIRRWFAGMQRITATHPELAFPALSHQALQEGDGWDMALMRDDRHLLGEWEEAFEVFPERHPLLVREFPDLEAMLVAPGFAADSRALYEPLFQRITSAMETAR